jgi:hypothetical protein
MTPARSWTALEIAKLKRLRAAGAPVKFIAHRLSRPVRSVEAQLSRLGIVVRPFCDNAERQLVRRYVGLGRTDGWIALKMGKTPERVAYVRCQLLGLKSNRAPFTTLGVGGGRRVRCFACNKLCPIGIARNWRELCGWKTREIDYSGSSQSEAYCPECFAKWGWGEMGAVEAVSVHPKPGDRVKLNVPDEPSVHGLLATVEQVTDWGVHLLIHRPPREYDKPNHVPRFRALFSEVVLVGSPSARALGYSGDPCPKCGAMKLLRAGACLVCSECGESTSC